MRLVARTEGIVVDPVYSSKGLGGLIGWVREGRFSPADDVVFIHTGGTPAIFAMADELVPEFQSAGTAGRSRLDMDAFRAI